MDDGTQEKKHGWEDGTNFRRCSVRWNRAELLDELSEMATAKGLTRNGLINEIAEAAVEKWRRKK